MLITDGDEILYTAAFVVEKTAYKLETSSGDVYDFGLKYTRDEIIHNAGIKGKAIKLDYKLHSYKVAVGDESHVRQCIKGIIKSLSKIGDVKLYLTSADGSNFRYAVAKTRGPNGYGYKAGRPPKPILYDTAREYLLQMGATEVFGYEADDALGMAQCDDTALVHIDKDINRIPGKHYNWKTKERYIVEQPGNLVLEVKEKSKNLRGTGNAFFFAQMLLGDRTDNIPSLGVGGDVKVYNLLKDCNTERDYFEVVAEKYESVYGNQYEDIMYEIADLVYILDSEKIRGSEYLRGFK